MSLYEEKKQAPLLMLQSLRIQGCSVFRSFAEIGITHVKQLLSMRIYDYLNLNHIDNNIAEEALICLYRFFYPERLELDDMIRYHEVDQPLNLTKWKRSIICKNVTVSDLLTREFVNENALSRIFYFVSQNFYRSDEYNWREYRYYDYVDYLLHLKQAKSAPARM